MGGNKVRNKIVILAVAVAVIGVMALAPTQRRLWAAVTGPADSTPADTGQGSTVISVIVAALLTLALGFIIAWLIAWIVAVRNKTQTGPLWGRVLIGAGVATLALFSLTLTPWVNLSAVADRAKAVEVTTTAIAMLPTWTALPTHTAAPTYTVPPTWTPQPTWTPSPTWTPTSTPTTTPTHTPTSTPQVVETTASEVETDKTPTTMPTSTSATGTGNTVPTATSTAADNTAPTATSTVSSASALPTATSTTDSTLPVTGIDPKQIMSTISILLLSGLLIGGGIWEIRRNR